MCPSVLSVSCLFVTMHMNQVTGVKRITLLYLFSAEMMNRLSVAMSIN